MMVQLQVTNDDLNSVLLLGPKIGTLHHCLMKVRSCRGPPWALQ